MRVSELSYKNVAFGDTELLLDPLVMMFHSRVNQLSQAIPKVGLKDSPQEIETHILYSDIFTS